MNTQVLPKDNTCNTPTIQFVVAPEPTQAVVGQPSILVLFHTLWFRRRLLFSTALFIITVGIIVLYQIEPLYKTTTTILIGMPKSKVVDIDEVLSTGLGNDASILTEVEVLRSRGLARKLIKKFNLRSKEEFNPVLRPPGLLSYINPSQWIPDQLKDQLKDLLRSKPVVALSEEKRDLLEMETATDIFLGKLTISPVRRSNVIKASFESTDPELATAIANEIPESYIIGQMKAKLEATEKATKWLDEQLSGLKKEVEESEKAVESYRERHRLTEVEGSKILGSQLMEANSQLIAAKAELALTKIRLQHIKQLENKSNSDIDSAKEVMSSQVVRRLKEQESSLTRKASELSVQFLPKHYKIKQVNAELKDTRERIKLEIKRIVVGLKNEVLAAQSKVDSISTSLMELETQSGEQTKQSVRLHSLEREASANRTLFETFLIRFKETSSTGGMLEADARVISMAKIPKVASFPNKRLMLVLIILCAFIIAIILVFLVQALNQGLLSPEQIANELGLATIGVIPWVQNKEAHNYLLEKPHSRFSEALSTLKTSLILSSPDEVLKVLQITSAVPGEGKSTISIALARLLSKSGNKVILLDGDLRRGSLLKKIGISTTTSKGLTDLVVTSGGTIDEFVVKDEKSGVFIMPNGNAVFVNATDIFSSHRMQEIVDLLKKNFDYIIIDTPPVIAVSDARILGKLVDKTALVVQWDKTPRKVIEASVQQLKDGGADIAGCILNQVDLQRYGAFSGGDSGYYYHYGRYDDYYTN